MQKLQKIPVEVTICQVDLRILVGWCGGEYVAMNYMHSFIETKRTLIHTANAQCHHSAQNDTIEIEIPEYGTINRIRLMMHLTGGVGEASFQPAGYSRPTSDCDGTRFTQPPNDQSRISYIDYSRHLQEKARWSTEEIRRAVVTYQLSVKVQKKVGYIVKQGKKLVVPDMIAIERTSNETLKDVTSGQRTTISNIGIDMMNKDLEGYHDAALGTIVFNKTKIPKTGCEEYRSVAKKKTHVPVLDGAFCTENQNFVFGWIM